MEDDLDFDSYEINPDDHDDGRKKQVPQGNDEMPNLSKDTKNSRNPHLRGAHSEKPNQRQRNTLASNNQNEQGI